jgi:hypothetical protein
MVAWERWLPPTAELGERGDTKGRPSLIARETPRSPATRSGSPLPCAAESPRLCNAGPSQTFRQTWNLFRTGRWSPLQDRRGKGTSSWPKANIIEYPSAPPCPGGVRGSPLAPVPPLRSGRLGIVRGGRTLCCYSTASTGAPPASRRGSGARTDTGASRRPRSPQDRTPGTTTAASRSGLFRRSCRSRRTCPRLHESWNTRHEASFIGTGAGERAPERSASSSRSIGGMGLLMK